MLFSLDGNIGAGKSTLLKKLEKTTFDKQHVVLYEPVDEWMNVRPEGPGTLSLFEKYYSDKKRYGFMFQMYALQSRLTHLQETVEKNPDKIIICERTHFTDAEIFAKMLSKSGVMDKAEYYVYTCWYDKCRELLHNIVKGVIYLRTSVPVCMTRIAQRSRDGEDNISVMYIKTLHDLHEEWLYSSSTCIDVCTINGDVDENEIDIQAIQDFINSYKS